MAETRAERLDRLLAAAKIPNTSEAREAKHPQTGAVQGAPYEFFTLPSGQRRLTINNHDTGERMGFVGKDVDDVLDQFEARVAPKG